MTGATASWSPSRWNERQSPAHQPAREQVCSERAGTPRCLGEITGRERAGRARRKRRPVGRQGLYSGMTTTTKNRRGPGSGKRRPAHRHLPVKLRKRPGPDGGRPSPSSPGRIQNDAPLRSTYLFIPFGINTPKQVRRSARVSPRASPSSPPRSSASTRTPRSSTLGPPRATAGLLTRLDAPPAFPAPGDAISCPVPGARVRTRASAVLHASTERGQVASSLASSGRAAAAPITGPHRIAPVRAAGVHLPRRRPLPPARPARQVWMTR